MCLWTRTNAIELVSTYICILRVHMHQLVNWYTYPRCTRKWNSFLQSFLRRIIINQQYSRIIVYRVCVCVCLCGRGGGGGCMASERASVSPKWIDFEVRINWQSRKCDNNPWKSKFSRARLKTPACKLNSNERLSLFLNLWSLNLPKSTIKQELKGSDSGSLSRKSSKQDVL